MIFTTYGWFFTTYSHDRWFSRHIQVIFTIGLTIGVHHDIYRCFSRHIRKISTTYNHDIYSRLLVTMGSTTLKRERKCHRGVAPWRCRVMEYAVRYVVEGFSSWRYVVRLHRENFICREYMRICREYMSWKHVFTMSFTTYCICRENVYVVRIFSRHILTMPICRENASWKSSTPPMM